MLRITTGQLDTFRGATIRDIAAQVNDVIRRSSFRDRFESDEASLSFVMNTIATAQSYGCPVGQTMITFIELFLRFGNNLGPYASVLNNKLIDDIEVKINYIHHLARWR